MPYPDKLQFAISKLIESRYLESDDNVSGCLIQNEKQSYILIETKDTGYTELTVMVPRTNVCITEFDNFPKWGIVNLNREIGMGKAVDHVVLTQSDNGKWNAYLIEMKTSMGAQTFEHVRQKTRANYYSVKALCVYLGIQINDDDFYVYVTYEELKKPVDTAVLKAPLGIAPKNVIKSEWERNRIIINIPEELELHLHPVKMQKQSSQNSPSGTALVGSITL